MPKSQHSAAWGGKRAGAGRKPTPPRIIRDHLVMSVKHLSREQKTELMTLIRPFWLDHPVSRAD